MHRLTAPAELRALVRQPANGAHSAASAARRETEEKRKSGPPVVPVDLQNSRFMRQSISNYVTQAADAQNNVVRLRLLTEDLRSSQLAALAAGEADGHGAAALKLENIMEDIGSLANRIRLQLKLMEPQPAAPSAASKGAESNHKAAAQLSQYQTVGAAFHQVLSRYYDLQCTYYKALLRAAQVRAEGSAKPRGGVRWGDKRAPDHAEVFLAGGPAGAEAGRSGDLDVQASLYDQQMQLQRVDAAIKKLHSSSGSWSAGASAAGSREGRGLDERVPCKGGRVVLPGLDVSALESKPPAPARTKHACKCALAFLFVFVLFCAVAAAVTATLLLVVEKKKSGR